MARSGPTLAARFGALARDQRGGSITEFAISTLVFVPLVLYGMWFADALHYSVVAEEAAIEPAFDATAHLTHDFVGGSSSDGLFSTVASTSGSQVLTELKSSYNSYDSSASPTTSSVLVHASNLNVTCQRLNGSGNGPGGFTGISNSITGVGTASLLPMSSWITCTSTIELDNLLIGSFMQDHAHVQLYDTANRNTIKICGMGENPSGCGSGDPLGFPIFLDDWGLEMGSANKLAVGSASGNAGFFNVGKQFYPSVPDIGVIAAMGAVTMIPIDLGKTPNYRLTYEPDGQGSYAGTEQQEGQGGPLGGPSDPRTGGPWLDEDSPHSDMDQTVFQGRQNNYYMARSDWPSD